MLKRTYLNTKVLIPFISLAAVLIFAFFFIGYQLSIRLEQLSFYNDVQNIYETSNAIDNESMYKVDGLCSVHLKSHGEFDKCNCIIKTEKLMLQKENTGLLENEVIISKNLASTNNLKVGDCIFLSSSVFDTFKEYKIKEIQSTCYGLKDINYMSVSGLMIFGYNEKIAELSKSFISFGKNSHNINNLSNINIYPLETSKKTIIGFVAGTFAGYFAFSSFASFTFLSLLFVDFKKVEKNKKKYGEANKILVKDAFIISSPLYGVFAIALLGAIIGGLCIINSSYLFISLLFSALLAIGIFVSQLLFSITIRRL